MITPGEAWAIILKQVRPLKAVRVPLADALGYCLAEEVRADRDLPPADRASMDGYAVQHEDLQETPCTLRVIGEVAAGSASRRRVESGTCVRILTGANVPPGADAVVMVEDTQENGGLVTIHSPASRGANIHPRGEDARKETSLLPRGARIDAMRAGVCAAVGKASLKVHARPEVAILCTGSELRAVAGRVRPHEIRNSNGPALSAALAQWGFGASGYRSVADEPGVLVAALSRALARHEVVLFTGGVSVGKYDYVREAVEAAGAKVQFHRLRMRPGRPTLYATAAHNRHVFGLPGNPLSSLTAFHEFVLPALRRLAGCPAEECRTAWMLPLAESVEAEGGFVRCALARVVMGEHGLAAAPVPFRSSADLVSAGHADGVVLLPPERTRFAAGESVAFRPWRPLP